MGREIGKDVGIGSEFHYIWCSECRDSFPVVDDVLCCPYGHKFTEIKCCSIADELENIAIYLDCLAQRLRIKCSSIDV